MELPSPVETYFRADRAADSDTLILAFTETAVVDDEGGRHRGRDAIRAWWHAARAKYRPVAEPLEATREGDQVLVRARVSGNFPNSPITLAFAFTLERDAIAGLRIG